MLSPIVPAESARVARHLLGDRCHGLGRDRGQPVRRTAPMSASSCRSAAPRGAGTEGDSSLICSLRTIGFQKFTFSGQKLTPCTVMLDTCPFLSVPAAPPVTSPRRPSPRRCATGPEARRAGDLTSSPWTTSTCSGRCAEARTSAPASSRYARDRRRGHCGRAPRAPGGGTSPASTCGSASTSTACGCGAPTRRSSAPEAPDGLLTITAKAVPDGTVSLHLAQELRAGQLVHLDQALGDFVLRPGPAQSPLRHRRQAASPR